MSYHRGLGQTGSSDLITIGPGAGGGVARLQQSLIERQYLQMRAPDGVISSGSSPTIAALQRFGTERGLPVAGIARSSTGGLTLPRALHDAVFRADMDFSLTDLVGGGSSATASAPPRSTSTSSGKTAGGAPSPGYQPPAQTGYSQPLLMQPTPQRNWLLWGIGGTLAIIGGGLLVSSMSR